MNFFEALCTVLSTVYFPPPEAQNSTFARPPIYTPPKKYMKSTFVFHNRNYRMLFLESKFGITGWQNDFGQIRMQRKETV